MNIFIGNLSFKTTDDDLRIAFEKFGPVTAARISKERDTGRSRGFGFVEMPDDTKARKAIEALNNLRLHDRPAKVSEAQSREARSPENAPRARV